ncbi:hypothetical protein ABPG72_021941 [Tetrahymena utriculariae]
MELLLQKAYVGLYKKKQIGEIPTLFCSKTGNQIKKIGDLKINENIMNSMQGRKESNNLRSNKTSQSQQISDFTENKNDDQIKAISFSAFFENEFGISRKYILLESMNMRFLDVTDVMRCLQKHLHDDMTLVRIVK